MLTKYPTIYLLICFIIINYGCQYNKIPIKIEDNNNLHNWCITGHGSGYDQQRNSWRAQLKFCVTKDCTKLQLTPQFATQVIMITVQNDGNATITIDKKTIRTNDIIHTLKTETGFIIPVNELSFWLKGLPAPNSKFKLSQQPYVTIKQNNWEIIYKDYSYHNNYQLPKKILMNNKQNNIRLFIKNWDIQD